MTDLLFAVNNNVAGGWKIGSAVISTGNSYKGSRFNFQYPHDLLLSVTLLLGDLTHSYSLLGHQVHIWYKDMYRQNTHTHKMIINVLKNLLYNKQTNK